MAADRSKVLVFAETKKKCDDLTRNMRKHGYPAMCIHGDKRQEERDWVLGEFKTGKTQILVATDVAARGLGRIVVSYVKHYICTKQKDKSVEIERQLTIFVKYASIRKLEYFGRSRVNYHLLY